MTPVIWFLFSGCERECVMSADQQDGIVMLSLVTEDMVMTRMVPDDTVEGDADGYHVSDFWLFEYKSDGKIAGSPRYFELGEGEGHTDIPIPVILPPAGSTYKCIIIANTHDDNFTASLSDYSTLSAMQKEYKAVSAYSDMYQTTGELADLLMNGSVNVTSTSAQISCVLYRNVAKLDVSLVNDASSGIVINSLQLRSVSDHLFYFDQAYAGASVPSPSESQSDFVNLPLVPVTLSAGTSSDYTFYLPRNLRGTNLSLDEEGKNVNVPQHATYLEVLATEVSTRTPLRYRFYIGKNMVNDFNVIPNYHYSLVVDFKDGGNQYADSRVEDIGFVLLSESNSYMIHPLSTDVQAVYAVPLSRINRFWTSGAGKENPDYANYVLGPSVEWEAEVIWQDCSERVIDFCDADGSYEVGNTSGTGVGDGYLYFRPTKAAYGNPCNVVIGVKRKGATAAEGYMWSWHIWMTDYNPDEEVGRWVDNKYVYQVEGGAVHRYEGVYWQNYYSDRYMMDRNLGARSALRADGLAANAGFGTQFGRKDVLPMQNSYPMYDIAGNSLGNCIKKEKGPVPMYKGVMNPLTFYYTTNTSGSAHGDWATTNPYYANVWNDIEGRKEGKSVFDPCPPGWELPTRNVWQNFVLSKKINAIPDSWQGVTNGWDLYVGGASSRETAFYPAAGWRDLSSGNIDFVKASEYWTSESYSNSRGRNLYMRELIDSYFEIPSNNYRSYGMSIRCIQE